MREGLLDKSNTAANVWADMAYRSAANETFMEKNGFRSHVHRKKPKGRPMPDAIRRANAAKSKIRSRVEHVFAEQRDRMALFVRTIGIARATVKIGTANLVYNFKRLLFLRRAAAALPEMIAFRASSFARMHQYDADIALIEASKFCSSKYDSVRPHPPTLIGQQLGTAAACARFPIATF